MAGPHFPKSPRRGYIPLPDTGVDPPDTGLMGLNAGRLVINSVTSGVQALITEGFVVESDPLIISGIFHAPGFRAIGANAIYAMLDAGGTFQAQMQYIDPLEVLRFNVADSGGVGMRRMEIAGMQDATEIGIGKEDSALPVSGIMFNIAGNVGISGTEVIGDDRIFSGTGMFLSGPLLMANNPIRSLGVPTLDSDAARKVDLGARHVDTFGSAFTTASVAPNGGALNFNVTGMGQRGTHVQRLQITPSVGMELYTLELYRTDAFSGSFQYQLKDVSTSSGIAVAELDESVGIIFDNDDSGEIHGRVINDGTVASGTFDLEIEGATIRT